LQGFFIELEVPGLLMRRRRCLNCSENGRVFIAQ
jgi:hypothetical protein